MIETKIFLSDDKEVLEEYYQAYTESSEKLFEKICGYSPDLVSCFCDFSRGGTLFIQFETERELLSLLLDMADNTDDVMGTIKDNNWNTTRDFEINEDGIFFYHAEDIEDEE